MGWVYNSMAASLVVHLGLHFPLPADLDHVSLTRKPSDAAGKRVFWSVCVLDRMATLTLGRNCAIPWRRIKIPFPGICEQVEGCETDTAFALQCRLSYLFDKYMDQIYTFDFDDQDAHSQLQLLMSARDALLGFQDRMNEHCPMPTSTTSNSVPTTAACLLYTSYYMSMILIHRPFLVISHTDTVRRVAFQTMTTAANASTKVFRNLMHHPRNNIEYAISLGAPRADHRRVPPHQRNFFGRSDAQDGGQWFTNLSQGAGTLERHVAGTGFPCDRRDPRAGEPLACRYCASYQL